MPAVDSSCRLLAKRAKFFYHACRLLQLFRFEYSRKQHRLELQSYRTRLRNGIWCAVACLVLLCLSEAQLEELAYLITYPYLMQRVDHSDAQEITFVFIIRLSDVFGLVSMCLFMFRRKFRVPLQRLLNDTLQLRRQVLHLTGRDVSVDLSFRNVLRCKYVLLLLYVLRYLLAERALPYYNLLFELFYSAYQTMQFTFLSLHRNLNFCTGTFVDLDSGMCCADPFQRDVKLWRQLARLLHRLHSSQQKFARQFAWFLPLVYFRIFQSVFFTFEAISCIFLAALNFGHFLYFLPAILLPIIDMGCICLLSDELHAEAQLSCDYFVIVSMGEQHLHRCANCKSLQQTRDVHVLKHQLQPYEVHMFTSVKINREFAFEYLVTILLFSLTFVQYDLTFQWQSKAFSDYDDDAV